MASAGSRGFLTPDDAFPPADLPPYSTDPTRTEIRLGYAVPLPPESLSLPNSAFTASAKKMSVTLLHQAKEAGYPTFGLEASIEGSLSLDNPVEVVQVELRLKGKMKTLMPQGGERSRTILNERIPLWPLHEEDANQSCPDEVPFAVTFPKGFRPTRDSTCPLPPSYNITFPGVHPLSVHSTYSLVFCVTRRKSSLISRLNNSSHSNLEIPFWYRPRCRPSQPPPQHLHLTPSLSTPLYNDPTEEWDASSSYLTVASPHSVEPIQCTLFIPKQRTFAMCDTIPVRVELHGPRTSFSLLFLSIPTSSSSQSESRTRTNQASKQISVCLLRQVSVEYRGEIEWRNVEIGEGTLIPLPPPTPLAHLSASSTTDMETLEWQGEVKAKKGLVPVVGFAAADVSVKDFVMVSIVPPPPAPRSLLPVSPVSLSHMRSSVFLPYKNAAPIRLTTDPFYAAQT